MNILFVYLTVPDKTTARSLAQMLVAERLLACTNIVDGVESCYWWQGSIENTAECLLIGKTTQNRYAALEARVREAHPYEVPCIVALSVVNGFAPFLRWIEEETTLPLAENE